MTRLLSPSTTDRDYWAIVDNLTRRGFFGVGAGVAAAAFLAACGSTESSTPEYAETFEFTRGDEADHSDGPAERRCPRPAGRPRIVDPRRIPGDRLPDRRSRTPTP
ncbi:hypothetical protein ACETU7_20635 [Rhodococcus sp. 3Y1]